MNLNTQHDSVKQVPAEVSLPEGPQQSRCGEWGFACWEIHSGFEPCSEDDSSHQTEESLPLAVGCPGNSV